MVQKKTVYRPAIFIEGFEYIKTLGAGGFATTHLFADIEKQYGEYVAVKVPHDKEGEKALVGGDIPSLAKLGDLPYIAKFLDVKSVGDSYVLLMEYVEGRNLRQLLGDVGSLKSLPIKKALAYTIHVAKGLGESHKRKMVHRDIKPENIIIAKSSDTPKILDFGIASPVSKKGHFKTTLGRHTPVYTPGEIFFEGKGDHRVDIYSLGMTLYEMLTGTLPYYKPDITDYRLAEIARKGGPKPPREINPQIPIYIEQAILKAISPNQNDRFQDMEGFIQALEPPPQIKMAEQHQKEGSIRRAEHVLRSLIKQRPDDPRGYVALANLLNRCYRSLEAKGMLEQVIELDSQDPTHHISMCMTLSRLGEKTKAEKYLRQAEDLCKEKRLQHQIESLKARLFGK
ncbi:MAG: hypothetical protein AVO38_14835 [delta proteobacterium ML8_D]|jgi:serine/threonine protein kinase|nr:MAG: hypothetical protein AVO38_14835 [delta proteobacterium ML8_D]